MNNYKIQTANKQIKSVTNLGIVINILLSVVKIIVGTLVGSISLFADGLHSVSDVTTDIAVLLGIHFGSKGPDEKHPYGHGRIETFVTGFVAVTLILVGCGMIYYASVDITTDKANSPNVYVLIVALLSIVLKEFLYRVTRKVAVRTHSSALYANAWHHRSDALSSVAVAAGYVAMLFEFRYGDQLAAIAVGLMILMVGVQILIDSFQEISESAVDKETFELIKSVIDSNTQIRQWHKLRTRMVGREVFLDLHILVDPNLVITHAHEIAEQLENSLHERITRPVNIIVHIEPDTPEMRK